MGTWHIQQYSFDRSICSDIILPMLRRVYFAHCFHQQNSVRLLTSAIKPKYHYCSIWRGSCLQYTSNSQEIGCCTANLLHVRCKSTTQQGSAVADKPARRAANKQGGRSVWPTRDRAKLTTLRVERRQFSAPSLHLTYPHLHMAPQFWGWPHLSFAEIFGNRHYEFQDYRVTLFAWSYV